MAAVARACSTCGATYIPMAAKAYSEKCHCGGRIERIPNPEKDQPQTGSQRRWWMLGRKV